MQWIHIINLIYVAYILNVSAFDQIGKFTRNFIANYVSHLLKSRQLQGAKPSWPGALPLDPTGGHTPRPPL